MALPFVLPFFLKALLVASAVTSGVSAFSGIRQAQDIKRRGKKVEEQETKRIAEEERLKKQSAMRIAKRRGARTTGKIPTRRDIRTSAIGIPETPVGGKALLGA